MKQARSARALLTVLVLAPWIGGCYGPQDGGAGGGGSMAPLLSRAEIAEDVRSAMDTNADPCQDFYRYACGNWLDTTELPGDEARWARSFSEINKRNREVLREILEKAGESKDTEQARLGGFYGACMDEATVEKAGLKPLQPLLSEISKVEDAAGLAKVAGKMQRSGIRVLFDAEVLADFKAPETNLTLISQGGLGLPDRDYYVEEAKKDKLDAYSKHVTTMFGLLGDDAEQAAANSAAVVAFETGLAKVSRRRAEMRDVERLYNKIGVAGLKKKAPSIPWDGFLAAIGYPKLEELNVATPEFFEGLDKLVSASDPATLQAYLRWHLVRGSASRLPKAFVDESFAFFGKTLQGMKEMRPRWRRCVNATDDAMGELLGKAYVEREFPGNSKAIALDMIKEIEAAFERNLPSLEWMDDTTRGRAVTKMTAILNKIGYPDEWRDYSSIAVKKDDYYGNVARANEFEFKRTMDKAGKPVDDTEWHMSPPEVNAYYNPLVNEMVFPAGILQQPFFHKDFPPAMNFGGIGMVMGHELTHGFDDMGRKFDPNGKMEQWWEDSAIEQFEERASCVEELYSTYEVQPGLTLNGKLTLGENIADLGGIKEAFYAYKHHATKNEPGEPLLDDLSHEQLFFVAFAQTWCMQATDEIVQMLATVDSHSHPRYRVVGPVSNLPEFAEVFACEAGTPMNPVEKCEVW